MSGQGTLVTPDGSRYTGAFSNDKPNGLGTLITPDGTRYVGMFRDGQYVP